MQSVVQQPHSGPLSLQQSPPHLQHQHTRWNSGSFIPEPGARTANTQPAGEKRNTLRSPQTEEKLEWIFKDGFGKDLFFYQSVFVTG